MWLLTLAGKALDALAKLGPLIGAFLAGAQRERLKSKGAAIEAGKTRNTVEDEVRRLDATAAASELQRDWRRG